MGSTLSAPKNESRTASASRAHRLSVSAAESLLPRTTVSSSDQPTAYAASAEPVRRATSSASERQPARRFTRRGSMRRNQGLTGIASSWLEPQADDERDFLPSMVQSSYPELAKKHASIASDRDDVNAVVVEFDEESCTSTPLFTVDALLECVGARPDLDIPEDVPEEPVAPTPKSKHKVRWISLENYSRPAMRALGQHYKLDSWLCSDILGGSARCYVHQSTYLGIIMRAIYPQGLVLRNDQVAFLVFNDNTLITVAPRPQPAFADLVLRLQQGNPDLRKRDVMHLAVSLMDNVVEGYFRPLEAFGDELEDLEDEIIEKPQPSVAKQVYEVKRQLTLIRRAAWPMREVWSQLLNSTFPLARLSEIKSALRASHDRTLQLIDVIETYRDAGTSLRELYTSTLSFEMDRVMKILTLVQAIFVPITFLSSVYGMNFKHGMWELNFKDGYYIFWVLCGLFGAIQVFLFRAYGWW
eukprot:m.487166 g.487166  ORF g.487166 m.487166 type:complete len:471 (-) comp24832_c0_seq1:156-1568(-)